jgi:predicted Zn-dependent peptidase
MNLREKHAWTYGASASIDSGKYTTKLKCKSSVRNAVTDSAVVEFIKEIKRIRNEKVSFETLQNVKAGYIGRFVMKAQKPQAIARYALNIQIENLSKDFYKNYIKNINAVTAEEVQAAANKYILSDNMRIIIVGKGSEVLLGLERLNIPIFYYDKYGNPVDKPIYNP